MNEAQADKLKKTMNKCINDTLRIEALNYYCGYWQDGTQATVTISQGDATREVYIRVNGVIKGSASNLDSALSDLVAGKAKEDSEDR
jgi:hypothetical protein